MLRIRCGGVTSGGCLRLWDDVDHDSRTLFVRDLNVDEMAMINDGAGQLCPETMVQMMRCLM